MANLILTQTAAANGLLSCHTCRLLVRQPPAAAPLTARCPRCGTSLHLRKVNSIARTWALVIAAFILYIPAN